MATGAHATESTRSLLSHGTKRRVAARPPGTRAVGRTALAVACTLQSRTMMPCAHAINPLQSRTMMS
eukprot:8415774-Prorocentrum_lima.AAC.1